MTATEQFLYKPYRMHIDVESFSPTNLKTCGMYRYWDDPDAEVILLSYALDDGPTKIFDLLAGEQPDAAFFEYLEDPDVLKIAFNAGFERQAILKQYGIYCDPLQWRDTMVLGLSLGLPGSLAMQARVLNMPIQKQEGIGKGAIKTFCIPCKATKKNDYRTRNYPAHFPDVWAAFKAYNGNDVDTERALWVRLLKYNQDCLWPAWALDQRINDRGVRVDMELVENAIAMNDLVKAKLVNEAARLTGLSNPNSVQQLIAWLNDAEDEEDKLRDRFSDDDDVIEAKITNLRKKTVIELLGTVKSPTALRVLELRQLMAKASVSKYRAMQRSVCRDGRIRGLLQYYGAARTGRWAGRILQVQNLPQNHLKDLAMCRALVKRGDLPTLELLFGESVLIVLSELIRTALIPSPGMRFISCDFKAIEARLTAWDAQEEWRLEVFRTHGLIYEASAGMMFNVPLDQIKKGGRREDLRPKGKVAELALGYQGGPNALINMGALEGKDAMKVEELVPTVKLWRQTSRNVVNGWYRTQDNAEESMRYKRVVKEPRYGFEFFGGTLFQILPTGRKLAYPHARIEHDEKFGKDGIVFDGINQYTHQWGTVRTFGGKLFQNRIQADGADLMIYALTNIEKEIPDLVFSVHDEGVMEVPIDWKAAPSQKDPKKSEGAIYVESLMCIPHKAFPGLPLAADADDLMFYRK